MADACLRSSFTSEYLTFRAIERFQYDSGYKLDVALQSGPFSAHQAFFVEPYPLKKFLSSLALLHASLAGEAMLKPEHEPQCILISAGSGGHMLVSGELIEHAAQSQSLRLHFRTDQTCVGIFLQQLRDRLAAEDF